MIPEHISPEDFRYNLLTPEDLYETTEKFEKSFEKFLTYVRNDSSELPWEVRINFPAIYRIIERIDQRKDYYLYFHSNNEHAMQMSQAKEVALFCYWFIRYKPLSFIKAEEEFGFFCENGYSINEFYAAFVLVSFIIGLNSDNKKYFTENAISTLTYSLANREISKEALVLYVESFCVEEEK